MIQDLATFRKVEVAAWAITLCVAFLLFWHLVVFIGFCATTRQLFLFYKRRQLPPVDPSGKWVLITGCDSGFGLGLAQRLHENGFNVLATCLFPERGPAADLAKLDGQLKGGARMVVLPLDVSDDVSVAKCLQLVKRECANTGLWGLVNNAGVNFVGDVELTTMEQYLSQGNVNLYGAVRTCKAFLPLLRQARGRIVNVSSVKGLCVSPSCAAYCIAKFGLEAFSDCLSIELAEQGVTVSVLGPCNFGGITGCLNDNAMKRIKSNLDEQWEAASDDVKQVYGEEHLPRQLEEARVCAFTTSPTIEPVLKAFHDALTSPWPRTRYLIKGSNSFFDSYYYLGLIHPYTPERLFTKLRSYFLPYRIGK